MGKINYLKMVTIPKHLNNDNISKKEYLGGII